MAALTHAQLERFAEEGYLVVEEVLDPAEVLDPVIEEYAMVLERLADELYEGGEISSRYEGLPFGERYIEICTESGQVHSQYFDFSLPFQNVAADTPFWAGPAVLKALTAPALLDAVESLIGPEIYSNPVQHVRVKPPEQILPKNKHGVPILGPTPWHQDNGVVTEDADDTHMLTVWFALEDTTLEKGPLYVVPRSHKNGLLTHCPNYQGNGPKLAGQEQIPQKIFAADQAIPLPVKRGDVIFLTRYTVHGSLSNESKEVRWSFDLRYNPIGQPTGRAMFPGFVARSRVNPASELHDPAEWTRLWEEARAQMALVNQGGQNEVRFRRWEAGHPQCA
jgi:phytanoyl-CoA hydroxylase